MFADGEEMSARLMWVGRLCGFTARRLQLSDMVKAMSVSFVSHVLKSI